MAGKIQGTHDEACPGEPLDKMAELPGVASDAMDNDHDRPGLNARRPAAVVQQLAAPSLEEG